MPVYEFKCKQCQRITERIFRISECPGRIKCACGKMAKKVLSCGVVFTDNNVKWLESAKMNLANDARYIKTRKEHWKYLKDHNLECIG